MSSTVMAAGVRPPDYRDYVWLYTAGDKVETVVDGAPPGPDGRLFTIEPDKAKRVPWEASRFILDHLGYTGIVRVKEKERTDKDGTVIGTDLDIDSARAESLAKFETADAERWRNYVQYVIDDKLNNKKVVPPPPEPIKALMQRRGYRLEDYGVNVPGVENAKSDDSRIKALESQNAQLLEANKELAQKLESFMKALGMDEPPKGKK